MLTPPLGLGAASLASVEPGLLCPLLSFCMPVGSDSSSLRSPRWRTACRPPSGKTPNCPCIDARIYKAHPTRGWRTWWSRAHSSRVYHTSYPVPVRRPARLDWASSRRHLAMNALALLLAFGSAGYLARGLPPREFCAMPGTHAGPEPRGLPRRLQALVRRAVCLDAVALFTAAGT